MPDLEMELPRPFTVWRHLKTDSTYTVLGVSFCSTNGHEGERVVVYYSHTYKLLHHRELGEFMDGRFELVSERTSLRAMKMLVDMRRRSDDGTV